jgi:hypothetical protein
MKQTRSVALLLATAAIVFAAAPAAAWSRQGHMAIGAIAHATLKAADPQALETVLGLLREHPHYDDLLLRTRGGNVGDDERDLLLFMNAARWADDVRAAPYESFGRSNWHYVNYHLEDGALRPPRTDGRDGRLLEALENNRAALSRGTPAERAVALTWIFHLVGDIHQPLHTIAYHSPETPNGDRGGNDFFIRVDEGAETIRLHWLWDGLLLGQDDFRAVRNQAITLRARPAFARDALDDEVTNLDFESWGRSGAQQAVEYVYRNGELRSGSEDDGAVLPSDYLKTVQPFAERQAVLSAYRLAALLTEIF